jgi:hypothetical protein
MERPVFEEDQAQSGILDRFLSTPVETSPQNEEYLHSFYFFNTHSLPVFVGRIALIEYYEAQRCLQSDLSDILELLKHIYALKMCQTLLTVSK